jgi:transcriptional regulator with XRE-family HTH domain
MVMSREEEEAVLRITSRYVAELRAGRQPRLSDYLLRYPQYADAITDFVTYYHAVEVDVPAVAPVAGEEVSRDFALPPMSEHSRAAMDRAWSRLSHSTQMHDHPYMTLQEAASNQYKSLRQLAGEVGLSVDIVEKLERRIIDAVTIPREFLKRLSQALKQPADVILGYPGFSTDKHMASRVAEAPANYAVEEQTDVQVQSFREAIEGSVELPNEQKDAWLAILNAEGL